MTLEEMKDDYNWVQAFGYGGKPGTYADWQGNPGPSRVEGADCSTDPFDLNDVLFILASVEGENDGAPWRAIGRLRDGRYFYLEAGCDYTGWDCQAGGSTWVSDSIDNLLQFGVTDNARIALGL